MFTARSKGLFDFIAAALCLWAAAYHTPPGAFLRGVVARIAGAPNTARPVLAYYSGGLYDARAVEVPVERIEVPSPELLASLGDGPALSRGVLAAYAKASALERERCHGLARKYQVDPALFADKQQAPDAASRLIKALQSELGSEEAAVLALFAGEDVARFAAERVRAERRAPTLEIMSAHLPANAAIGLQSASNALTLGTAYSLGWPVAPGTRVSSAFGWRNHPTLGRAQLHTGVDLAVPNGTLVKATSDGTIRRASEDAVNGRVVIIDHGHGVTTAYCHNSLLLVSVGQKIRGGEVIAESGTTGRSTGPHVHYQLELGHQPMDPFLFKGAGAEPPDVPKAKATTAGPPAVLPPTPKPSRSLRDAIRRAGVLDAGPDEPPTGESPSDATEH